MILEKDSIQTFLLNNYVTYFDSKRNVVNHDVQVHPKLLYNVSSRKIHLKDRTLNGLMCIANSLSTNLLYILNNNLETYSIFV